MKPTALQNKSIPLDIVGSSTFGRYPKISVCRTFNMIISDNWLVDYAGYKLVAKISNNGVGRAIYASTRLGRMIAVIDNHVYAISPNLSYQIVGTINTYSGDVYIAENNASQIAICDQSQLWIYDYSASSFTVATLPTGVIPGYVTFQNGYFIVPDILTSNWYLSAANNGTSWNWGAGSTPVAGAVQTKPDFAVAAQRIPGRGNNLFVFGKTVTEQWTDVGAQLFPYQRNSSINIDYGCLSASTIASNETIVAWLGANENSGPTIMYSTGGDVQQISSDGINFKLSQLTNPSASEAFIFKQDGHIFYQITFFDPEDNFTLAYDFTTGKFYDLTDENMNFHIAKQVAFFNNNYYFVSFRDGNIYQLGTNFTNYDYGTFEDGTAKVYEIPRIRVCSNVRLPDSSRFIVNSVTWTMEQGTDTYYPGTYLQYLTTENGIVLTTEGGIPLVNEAVTPYYAPRVDLSVSKDGGESFSSDIQRPLNPLGKRKNRLIFWGLGAANDFVPQIRFWGLSRFVATNGEISIYQ